MPRAFLYILDSFGIGGAADAAAFGDEGYMNNKLKRPARKAGLFWGVPLKASKQHPLTRV